MQPIVSRQLGHDRYIERAIAAPLHESVRLAAERASQQAGKGKRKGGVAGITQTVAGGDVTEIAERLEAHEREEKAQLERDLERVKVAASKLEEKAAAAQVAQTRDGMRR